MSFRLIEGGYPRPLLKDCPSSPRPEVFIDDADIVIGIGAHEDPPARHHHAAADIEDAGGQGDVGVLTLSRICPRQNERSSALSAEVNPGR